MDSILRNECSSMFGAVDWAKIGGAESECAWRWPSASELEMKADLELLIVLGSSATISFSDSLTLKIGDGDGDAAMVIIDGISISIPSAVETPNVIISSKVEAIGICDDLVLDARSSTNLGGRAGRFQWNVTNLDDAEDVQQHNGSFVVIDGESLGPGTAYQIDLAVTNWYGAAAHGQYDVFKSNTVTPMMAIKGTSRYSPTNKQLNGMVHLYSVITFNADTDCIDDIATNHDGHGLEYGMRWSVDIEAIDGDADIDSEKEEALNRTLSENEDAEALWLDAALFLESGFVYHFTANLQCHGSFECSLFSSHSVLFDHSLIRCGMFCVH